MKGVIQACPERLRRHGASTPAAAKPIIATGFMTRVQASITFPEPIKMLGHESTRTQMVGSGYEFNSWILGRSD